MAASGSPAATAGIEALFLLAGVALFVLLVTTVWAARRPVWAVFVYVQLVLDVLLASVLSALTGGADSLVSLLYFPAIAGAAYVLGIRGASVVAGLCTVGFFLVLVYSGLPDGAEMQLIEYSNVVLHVLAFFLVAILTGQLAETAERTGIELRAERAVSEVVLERVRAGVLTTDSDDVIIAANPAARLLVGDAVGKRLTELFSGSIHHRAWEEERPDRRRWICSQASMPSGGRVVVVEDVTELLVMRERAARDERLVAAGRVAASMAHEIRNPLASLSGSLQMIREDHPSRLVDLALEESARLNRLVEEFLESARTPALRRQLADVHALARDVTEAFSRDPRFLQTVRVRCEGQRAEAWIDSDRVRQILWNLMLNGAQAMPRGGEILVDVTAINDATQTGVRIRVADEGVGIPPEDVEQIFDPFYTRRAGGSGIGLATVDQVIRGHGGTVAVRVREQGGTEFTLWVPSEEMRVG